jgi:serine/threonine protein phosphatase 1
MLDSHVPDEHRDFLQTLPIMLETSKQVFVHAGLRAGVPLDRQEDSDLIWIRDDYGNDFAEFGRTVVHGHTPIVAPLVTPGRIGIDTGAFMTGRLSAVRLSAGEEPQLFSTAQR